MFSSMMFLFFSALIMTSILALSTDSWFQIWAALELNMMTFIPLMYNKDNLSINSMMKYFIIQAFASALFMFSMIFMNNYYWDPFYNNFIVLAMTMKLGLFPVYFWFPQVSEGLSWLSFTLLSTWQKIIPLYILSSSSKIMFSFIITFSSLIGWLGMLNQTSTRKLFAFSSLTHMSWMLLSMMNLTSGWGLYFSVYTGIMISIYLVFKPLNISILQDLKVLLNKFQMATMMVVMMSLGGLPPFVGFLPKWMIISNCSMTYYFLMFILIISSLVSIFVYLRLIYPLMFTNFLMNKKTCKYNYMTPILMNSTTLIPLMPFIFF
uniref:NADH dehydrogenase subunit 2 n=1 Tax=Poecilochirus davydovae TaxID=3128885 RepID=UPI0030E4C53F